MANSLFPSSSASNVNPILSESYSDIIFRYQLTSDTVLQQLQAYDPQIIDGQYSILHAPLADNLATTEELSYSSVPKLFTYIDTTSLANSGILAVQQQSYLRLSGKGVLIGFLDSGIDYTHPAFRNPDGSTRIIRLWDQTISESSDAPFGYGTEYTDTQINEALFSSDPYEHVPSRDESGHGTAAAGIACGSADASADFTGAAFQSGILMVKLKPAKQYLRDYFLIPSQSAAFQETDLMMGIRYLSDTAKKLGMPLIICITLGTNQGGHTGATPLEEVLASVQFNAGIYVVTGTGNETGMGHHYAGKLSEQGDRADIELLVNQETSGFTLEFWADAPELYSIGFTSPLGESILPVQPRNNTSQVFDFLLEASRVFINYTIVEMLSGSQVVQIRFQNPTTGIWRIQIINKTFINGTFHLWLPITGLVDPEIRFYSPNPDTTLTIPSCTPSVITVSTYDSYSNSLFINSGRGFTRSNNIKPDFASPGVNLTAPRPSGLYGTMTGSCAASALTAGAAALLVEGGLRQNPPRYFTIEELKSLFLRGTGRNPIYSYPNREWGYGTMQLYDVFQSFLRS